MTATEVCNYCHEKTRSQGNESTRLPLDHKMTQIGYRYLSQEQKTVIVTNNSTSLDQKDEESKPALTRSYVILCTRRGVEFTLREASQLHPRAVSSYAQTYHRCVRMHRKQHILITSCLLLLCRFFFLVGVTKQCLLYVDAVV